MKIKKVEDKPMVIHTKQKAEIHTHEPKQASIKGNNIYMVERGTKTKSTIHQTESKDKTWVRESYVFEGDFIGQGFYNITISMSQKDYKKYKKIISQMVANCQIREWEPQ